MKKNIQYSIFNIQYSSRARGFTLIELLVTLSIFLAMTSVVLARYRSYSVNADFANTVENVMLSLREAQVYGVGSKAAGASVTCGSPASEFNCAYGVYFVNAGTSYIIFVDVTENNTYDLWEMIQTINLPSGISLLSTPSLPIDVVFKRPFPDAIINNYVETTASITVSDSKSGKSQIITISSTGMISVQ